MHMRTAAIAVIAAVLLAGSVSFAAKGSHAIAAPPQPTATYISELGPVSVQPPRHAVALPASGSGLDGGVPWPKLAGVGLALCGALLIHIALRLRPRQYG